VGETTAPTSRARGGAEAVLFGAGLLADAIERALSRHAPIRRVGRADLSSIPGACPAVVASTDGWDTSDYPAVRKMCVDRNVPWLPVRSELGDVVIGPVELPNTPGCGDCAELRRRLARRYPEGHAAAWRRHGPVIRQRPSSLLTRLAADLVAALVADEVEKLVTDWNSARTRCAMLYVDLRTLQVTVHRFLPDPRCHECGALPADDASSARIELKPRAKPVPDRYRTRALVDEMPTLLRSYVDDKVGIVRDLYRDSHSGVAVAVAPMGLRDGGVENGYGRTHSYRMSELTALLEALERHGGMCPGGKRTTVRASYREVTDKAVDPRTLGLHPGLADHRFQPFADDQPYRWVWAYSFAKQASILVPESYAYYRVPRADAEPAPFVYEVSNGCALGGCLEEAILYGLLEVAERDAFLMTWYTNMRVPRIDLQSARDRVIPMIAAAIRDETGYDTMIFDTTLEQGVPCVWAMAVDPTNNAERPKAVCAAGSHLDLEQAAGNALRELGSILAHLIETYPQQRVRARQMAAQPELVTAMADHALLYGDPSVFPRLNFLTDSPRVHAFAELAWPGAFRNADLREDVLELIGRYLECGLDVIVVDQTTPEHRVGGFSCVKVIVPGTLPMTFGHHYRRVDGLPRLYEVPRLLGHRDRLLTPEDINPHPHPFP
jgi:ribosomal protein S12 methylthiotransferase accessory factor